MAWKGLRPRTGRAVPPADLLSVVSADLLAASADPPDPSQMTLSVRVPSLVVSNSPAGGGIRLLLQSLGDSLEGERVGRDRDGGEGQ